MAATVPPSPGDHRVNEEPAMPAPSPVSRRTSPVAVGLLVICALVALMTAPPAVSLAADPSPQRIRDAVHFREDFGLRSDRAYVRNSFGDPAFSDGDWGLPLDPDELADLRHRVEIQSALGPAIGYATSQSASGGVYIDQRNHGWPVFLFTGDLDTHTAAIKERLPDWVRFSVRMVARSWADLLGMKDAVEKDGRQLGREGVTIVSLGPDTIGNTLVVGVLADLAHARRVLARYGDGIVVELDQPAQLDDGLPPTDSMADGPPAQGPPPWWTIIILCQGLLGGSLFVLRARSGRAIGGTRE
jgi:hypothetical protein